MEHKLHISSTVYHQHNPPPPIPVTHVPGMIPLSLQGWTREVDRPTDCDPVHREPAVRQKGAWPTHFFLSLLLLLAAFRLTRFV